MSESGLNLGVGAFVRNWMNNHIGDIVDIQYDLYTLIYLENLSLVRKLRDSKLSETDMDDAAFNQKKQHVSQFINLLKLVKTARDDVSSGTSSPTAINKLITGNAE